MNNQIYYKDVLNDMWSKGEFLGKFKNPYKGFNFIVKNKTTGFKTLTCIIKERTNLKKNINSSNNNEKVKYKQNQKIYYKKDNSLYWNKGRFIGELEEGANRNFFVIQDLNSLYRLFIVKKENLKDYE